MKPAFSNVGSIAAILVLTACGSGNGPSIGQGTPAPQPVNTTASPLVGGSPVASVNVTYNHAPFFSVSQSETAAVTLDSPPGTTLGHAVAYNSFENGFNCTGDSMSAMSYAINSSPFLAGATFVPIQLNPPNGAAELLGDPAIGVQDAGSSWTVFVSSLAVSSSTWSGFSDADGCLKSGFSPPSPDQICVNAVSINKSTGAWTNVPSKTWCAGSGGAAYDGTALFTTPTTHHVFAASMNDQSEVDVFEDGAQLANPFPNMIMVGHVIFANSQPVVNAISEVPTLVAVDNAENLWGAMFNLSTHAWTTQKLQATSGYQWGPPGDVKIRGFNLQLRQVGLTAVQYTKNALNTFMVFYTEHDPMSGFARVQGVLCDSVFTNSFGGCGAPAAFITPNDSNAYLPAATVNFGTGAATSIPSIWLSYWSDSTQGPLQMNMTQVQIGVGFKNWQNTGVVESPCWQTVTEENGITDAYWGDYDGMTVANYASLAPSLLRYLTDSTNGTCMGPSSIPQSISVTLGNADL